MNNPPENDFGPLVSAEALAQHFKDAGLRIVDVRWRIGKPGEGKRLYEESHIPGAAFLDMDTDLADTSDPKRGRHALADLARFVERLAEVGIGEGTRVLAYDDAGGTHAARLWWMLRWLGVEAAVLDGGFQAWT